MTTADKVIRAKADYDAVFNNAFQRGWDGGYDEGQYEGYVGGRQAEWDAFWDAYQENGNKTNYGFGFTGLGWTSTTFKPKYPIRPTGDCAYMFYSCGIGRKGYEYLKEIDFSNVTSFYDCFAYSAVVQLGVIDLSKATNTNRLFSGCKSLTQIDKLIVASSTPFTDCFKNCTNLTNITVEGTIAQNGLDLHWSTQLSHNSITSIINALSNTACAKTLTLSKDAVDREFRGLDIHFATVVPGSESAEWYNIITFDKPNWEIVLG